MLTHGAFLLGLAYFLLCKRGGLDQNILKVPIKSNLFSSKLVTWRKGHQTMPTAPTSQNSLQSTSAHKSALMVLGCPADPQVAVALITVVVIITVTTT